ncbi:hypothetical protein V6Z12_A12G000800 [Gossypium hirsutum]|uniref:HIT domain-containing protein n=1 Tax=Gossypium hirsutum TaxID=3635 RepID=A0A1U8MYH6_GOSHI|nr:uncharacterized protein LOC107942697 [Gossypium hirsutum]XP_040938292.1 uncharacterized protein LOC107942697 [Gossypium hirsutum]XP_040938293.1 uncharacterized protein LOC107942697 [Gossypium hirsutum]XP_040938294.1 uncharacterized protein LOC107942697 [Gossypium hirsutum]XP_040938295.1 uncharacterized protein LOC107942697 [Gossypium hirsutum]
MSVWLILLDALGKKEILVLQDFTSHGLSFTVNYFIIHILYYIDSSQIDTLFPSSYCMVHTNIFLLFLQVLAFRDIAPQAPMHILIIPKSKDGLTGLSKNSKFLQFVSKMSRGELIIDDNQVKPASENWATEYQQQYTVGASWADEFAHDEVFHGPDHWANEFGAERLQQECVDDQWSMNSQSCMLMTGQKNLVVKLVRGLWEIVRLITGQIHMMSS